MNAPRRLVSRYVRVLRPVPVGLRTVADRLNFVRHGIVLAIVLGAVPVLIDYAWGLRGAGVVTACLGWLLLLAAAARDRFHPALTILTGAFVVHSATVIVLAALDPDRLAVALPAGRDYWIETEHWIRTGESVKYDVGWWVPVHLQLLVVVLLWGGLSLGLVPLLQGLVELDMMNFYVGRLLASSDGSPAIVFLAWHPWSVCRGIGFLFVTFETARLPMSLLAGEPLLSTAARRRLLLAAGFLMMDALLKAACSEPVRLILADALDSGRE